MLSRCQVLLPSCKLLAFWLIKQSLLSMITENQRLIIPRYTNKSEHLNQQSWILVNSWRCDSPEKLGLSSCQALPILLLSGGPGSLQIQRLSPRPLHDTESYQNYGLMAPEYCGIYSFVTELKIRMKGLIIKINMNCWSWKIIKSSWMSVEQS